MPYPLLLLRKKQTTPASLLLDFTSGSLPSGVTLTRSSTGTYFNSSGVLSLAANDAPRFDYDPSTLALRGLLIEPSKSNALYSSSDLSGYTTAGITFTNNAATSPDGSVNAPSIIASASGVEHKIQSGSVFSISSGTTYTYSAFIKANGYQWAQIYAMMAVGGAYANFDVLNGVLGTASQTSGATNVSSTMRYAGNGWYRCSLTYRANGSSGAQGFTIDIQNSGTASRFAAFTGDGVSGLYVYGPQVEAGASSTSYVPTTSAAVTRAADACTFTIPSGVTTLRYTFDDNSTQDVSVSAGAYTVPTNLNRPWIKTIVGI